MNQKEEIGIISNALQFLQRTDIKGSEVQTFTAVTNYLNQKGQAINESLQIGDDKIVDAVIED